MIAAQNDGPKSRKRLVIVRHRPFSRSDHRSSSRVPNRLHVEAALADLRRSVANYEIRYGLGSEMVHEAIDRGILRETDEVCSWLMDYERLRRATAKQGRRRPARVEL